MQLRALRCGDKEILKSAVRTNGIHKKHVPNKMMLLKACEANTTGKKRKVVEAKVDVAAEALEKNGPGYMAVRIWIGKV